MYYCDHLIIGAGVAGMTVACELHRQRPGAEILLIERELTPGGILKQCIHTGFGPRNLTGPEYEKELEANFLRTPVKKIFGAEVTQIKSAAEADAGIKNWQYLAEVVTSTGILEVACHRLLLATGCYERPIGSLMISGSRPEGIFTAGELQRRMNLEGFRPQKSAVVIGSGDIGLLVARRLILNGTIVKRIVEIKQESPALARNKKRCLEKHHLPLQLHSRVVEIHGKNVLEGVTLRDNETGAEEYIACEILVVAAGLIPDRMLTADLPEEMLKDIVFLGNCEKIYSMAEHIVSQVKVQCRNLCDSE